MTPNQVARQALLAAALGAFALAVPARAQLDASCVVSAFNRSAPVREDGSWRLPNVPANQGRVRVRATCVADGAVRSGQSPLVTLEANGQIVVPPIDFSTFRQIPSRLALTAPEVRLAEAGATVQILALATYPDGSTEDVSAGSLGTSYRSSNPAIADVDGDGLVTARASGIALVSAVQEGALAILEITVVVSGDSDGDGIPDDLEMANGLDPHDPVDALLDLDGDGLTNAEELLTYGTAIRNADTDGDGLSDGEEVTPGGDGFLTNPALADTDGDGVADGLEIETHTDPTDPASFDLALALASISLSPQSLVLTFNPLFGEVSRQVAVTGHLRDGRTLDLTSRARGTTYLSSDLSICNFGSDDGRIFAGAEGTCTVTATNAGYSATVLVTVRSFRPTALSYLDLPGYPNNVDVSGPYAFVADGDAGLAVVDVSVPDAPSLATILSVPGIANDVRVVGDLAYLADGSGGLAIVDVSSPDAPQPRGLLAPAGVDFRDVVVRGGVAYVADRNGRFWRIDVSDPDAPAVIDMLDLTDADGVPLILRGVAVAADGTFATIVAASGGGGGGGADLRSSAIAGSGLTVIDLTDPIGLRVAGTVPTGDARDVAIEGRTAYVADLAFGLTVVSLADLSAPAVVASAPADTGGLLLDVELTRGLAFGADVVFVNGVPISAISGDAPPQPRAILDFSAYGDENGSGIAVDSELVYLTAGFAIGDEQTSGGGRLYIGRYAERADDQGVPPTVAIASPADGATVFEGAELPVAATAADDVGVARVDFLADGVPLSSDVAEPFEAKVVVPTGATALTLGARAVDFGANEALAPEVTVQIVPDPLTTVVGSVLAPTGEPIADAQVESDGIPGIVAPDGTFSIAGVPTIHGPIVVNASGTLDGEPLTARSAGTAPVPGGTTDVGTIVLQGAACATGELSFDAIPASLRAIFLCRTGPVTQPVDLYRLTDGGAGIAARARRTASAHIGGDEPGGRTGNGTAAGEEFLGQVVPDSSGRFCAELRTGDRYLLRAFVTCEDGQIQLCSAPLERHRSDITAHCSDASPVCESLGPIVFPCEPVVLDELGGR